MINLDKGSKISLDKEFPGLTEITFGLGWYPPGYVPKRNRQSKERDYIATIEPAKGGFLNKLGDMLKGNARVGDVVNAGIDSTKNAVSSIFADNDVTPDMRNYFDTHKIDIDASIVFLSNGKIVDKSKDLLYFGTHKLNIFGGAVRHMGDNLTGVADDMDGDKEQIYINLSQIPSTRDEAYVLVNIYDSSSRNQHFGMVNGAYIRAFDPKNEEELIFTNLSGKEYDNCQGMYAAHIYKYNGEWRYEPEGKGVKKASHIDELLTRFR